MKIVVLDGYTLNPGDLSWSALKELGKCDIYDRTAPDELLDRAHGARALLTNKVILERKTMEHLPELGYIGVLATGYNVVDLDAAREKRKGWMGDSFRTGLRDLYAQRRPDSSA